MEESMKQVSDEFFWAQVFYFGTIAIICVYLYAHGVRQDRQRRMTSDIDQRVKVIEMWPDANEKREILEQRVSHLEEDMGALKSNPITAGTLRLVKHTITKKG